MGRSRSLYQSRVGPRVHENCLGGEKEGWWPRLCHRAEWCSLTEHQAPDTSHVGTWSSPGSWCQDALIPSQHISLIIGEWGRVERALEDCWHSGDTACVLGRLCEVSQGQTAQGWTSQTWAEVGAEPNPDPISPVGQNGAMCWDPRRDLTGFAAPK